jgi:hypothetical protein
MFFLGSLLSIVVECKGNHVSQRDIVVSFMRSLDPSFPDNDDEMSTHLAGGTKNPSDYVHDSLKKMTIADYSQIETYFSENVIPLIKENEYATISKALVLIIREDCSIDPYTVVDVISGTKKNDMVVEPEKIASFLAGVFLYALKNTSNRRRTGLAKELAKKYVERARTEELPVFRKEEKVKSQSVLPDDSTIRLFNGVVFSSAGIAIVLREWSEENKLDKAMIEKLSGKNYVDIYEDLLLQDKISITCKKGVVKCGYDALLRGRMTENVTEHHLILLLTSFCEAVSMNSRLDAEYSKVLNSLSDYLAFLGNNIINSNRIERDKWDSIFLDFFIELLNDKKVIESCSSYFEVLLEANPSSFLDSIEKLIHEPGSVLLDCLNDSYNKKLVYDLAYSLRKLAAYRECFTGAMSLLFELSSTNEKFFTDMRCIILPEYMQTEADFKVQIGIMKNFFMRDDDLAWKLLRDLLPGYSRGPLKRTDFRYYPIRFMEQSEIEVCKDIEVYVELACANIGEKSSRVIDLVRICPYLSVVSVNNIVDTVLSEINELDDIDALHGMVKKYVIDYSLGTEQREAFSKINSVLDNNCDKTQQLDAFKNCYPYIRDDNDIIKATEYVLGVYKKEGFGGLVVGFEKVEDRFFFCEILLRILDEGKIKELCYYLADRNLNNFLEIVINGIKSEELVRIIDKSHPKYVYFLCNHICDSFMLSHVQNQSSKFKKIYWNNVSRVNIGDFDDELFGTLVELLVKYKNYILAFRVLSIRIGSGSVKKEQVLKLLEEYTVLDNYSENWNESGIMYDILKALMYIESEMKYRLETLSDMEEKYIRFFRVSGVVGAYKIPYGGLKSVGYFFTLIKHHFCKIKLLSRQKSNTSIRPSSHKSTFCQQVSSCDAPSSHFCSITASAMFTLPSRFASPIIFWGINSSRSTLYHIIDDFSLSAIAHFRVISSTIG